jgi:hypothetical protein
MSYYAVNPTQVLPQRDALFQHIGDSPNGLWLALVDTAFDHGGSALKWRDTTWPLYHAGRLEALEKASPVLIPLTVQQPDALRGELLHLLSHSSGRPMLSFIRATEPAVALCQRWQDVLEVALDEGEPYLLRFADTRVSPAIAALKEQALWQRLHQTVQQWLIVNRQGEVQALPAPASAPEPLANTQEPLVLSPSVCSDLMAAGQPDALIQALQERFAEYLPKRSRASAHTLMTQVCEMATAHGVEAFPDLLGLALATLASDGKLLHNERLHHWLHQRAWPPGQFDQALLDFMEPA